MPVSLLGSKVLVTGTGVAISDACCCGCSPGEMVVTFTCTGTKRCYQETGCPEAPYLEISINLSYSTTLFATLENFCEDTREVTPDGSVDFSSSNAGTPISTEVLALILVIDGIRLSGSQWAINCGFGAQFNAQFAGDVNQSCSFSIGDNQVVGTPFSTSANVNLTCEADGVDQNATVTMAGSFT